MEKHINIEAVLAHINTVVQDAISAIIKDKEVALGVNKAAVLTAMNTVQKSIEAVNNLMDSYVTLLPGKEKAANLIEDEILPLLGQASGAEYEDLIKLAFVTHHKIEIPNQPRFSKRALINSIDYTPLETTAISVFVKFAKEYMTFNPKAKIASYEKFAPVMVYNSKAKAFEIRPGLEAALEAVYTVAATDKQVARIIGLSFVASGIDNIYPGEVYPGDNNHLTPYFARIIRFMKASPDKPLEGLQLNIDEVLKDCGFDKKLNTTKIWLKHEQSEQETSVPQSSSSQHSINPSPRYYEQ
jgi:hypothetical protein